jgi:hypothetical protein
MLASLNADDPRSKIAEADRLTIEGTIQITDGVVAEKDREIARLEQRLAEKPEPSSAAVDALVNQDEIIAQHRADVERLRAEWTEKVRTAEVELSLERAKLARERSELEERRAEFEAMQANSAKEITVPTTPGDPSRKPAGGGRWLARLGLKEKDGE